MENNSIDSILIYHGSKEFDPIFRKAIKLILEMYLEAPHKWHAVEDLTVFMEESIGNLISGIYFANASYDWNAHDEKRLMLLLDNLQVFLNSEAMVKFEKDYIKMPGEYVLGFVDHTELSLELQ